MLQDPSNFVIALEIVVYTAALLYFDAYAKAEMNKTASAGQRDVSEGGKGAECSQGKKRENE